MLPPYGDKQELKDLEIFLFKKGVKWGDGSFITCLLNGHEYSVQIPSTYIKASLLPQHRGQKWADGGGGRRRGRVRADWPAGLPKTASSRISVRPYLKK